MGGMVTGRQGMDGWIGDWEAGGGINGWNGDWEEADGWVEW